MKNLKKKGFTIVELVIVIAVIAVIAAVLIPTFVNLTRKANISADTVLAKNLNTALALYDAENDIEDFDDVLEAIKEHGYLIANLNAKAEGCYFVWESETNQILLVDSTEDYAVLYSTKDGYATPDDSWYFAISNKEKADAVKTKYSTVNVKQTIASVNDLKGWISSGGSQTIYIDESISVNTQEQLVVDGGELTIKLSDSTISGNNNSSLSTDNIPFLVKSGMLTLDGGLINATGSYLDADGEPVDSAVVAEGGILNLINTTIDGTGKSILVAYTGATGKVSNTKIVSHGGNIVIEDGEFSATQYNVFKLYTEGSNITIKGGTFTSQGNTYTFDMLTVDIVKSMVATSAGEFEVVKNSDGTFTISK